MTDEANILALMHSLFTLVNYHWFIILLSSRKKGKDFCRAVSWQETLTFTINLWMIRKGFHIQFSAQWGSSLTNQMYMVLYPSKQWIFHSVRNIVLSCYIEGSPGKKLMWRGLAAVHTHAENMMRPYIPVEQMKSSSCTSPPNIYEEPLTLRQYGCTCYWKMAKSMAFFIGIKLITVDKQLC